MQPPDNGSSRLCVPISGGGFFAGGNGGFGQHSEQLFRLLDKRRDPALGQQVGKNDEFQPTARFAHLLGRDTHLVSEIFPALGGARFVVVRRGRGTASNQLSSHVPPGTGVRQGVRDRRYTRCEPPKTIRELIRGHLTPPSNLSTPTQLPIPITSYQLPVTSEIGSHAIPKTPESREQVQRSRRDDRLVTGNLSLVTGN